MKVNVRLHGTLRQNFSGYSPSHGIEIEIPDGATIKDLLAHLEMQKVAVIANGRVLKVDAKMQDGSFLDVFNIIQGG